MRKREMMERVDDSEMRVSEWEEGTKWLAFWGLELS